MMIWDMLLKGQHFSIREQNGDEDADGEVTLSYL